MKYDFFQDLNKKHGLCCSSIYSKLFKGVKFIPNTYYIVSGNNENNETIITVEIQSNLHKSWKEHINFTVRKQLLDEYIIHDVFFVFDNNYFVISDIHMTEDGIIYNFEYYDEYSYITVCNKNKTLLPKPTDFKQLSLKPEYAEKEVQSKFDSSDPITFLMILHLKLKEWHNKEIKERNRK